MSKILYIGTSVKQARKFGNTCNDLGLAKEIAKDIKRDGVDGKHFDFINIYNCKGIVILRYGTYLANQGWFDAVFNSLDESDVKRMALNSEDMLHIPEPIAQQSDEEVLECSEESEIEVTVPGIEHVPDSEAKVIVTMHNASNKNKGMFSAIPLSTAFTLKGNDELYVKVGKTAALKYSANKVQKVRIQKKQKVRVRNVELMFSI